MISGQMGPTLTTFGGIENDNDEIVPLATTQSEETGDGAADANSPPGLQVAPSQTKVVVE